jgi:hypothetical protein
LNQKVLLTCCSYIKELADRINSIEGKLNTGVSVNGLERTASSDIFPSPGLGDESRKRPFSSVSGDGAAQTPPNKIAGFSTEHRPILPYVQPDFRAPNSGNPTDLAPKPLVPAHFSGETNDAGLQDQAEMMDGIQQNGLPQGSAYPADQTPEIEDAAFNRYVVLRKRQYAQINS